MIGSLRALMTSDHHGTVALPAANPNQSMDDPKLATDWLIPCTISSFGAQTTPSASMTPNCAAPMIEAIHTCAILATSAMPLSTEVKNSPMPSLMPPATGTGLRMYMAPSSQEYDSKYAVAVEQCTPRNAIAEPVRSDSVKMRT